MLQENVLKVKNLNEKISDIEKEINDLRQTESSMTLLTFVKDPEARIRLNREIKFKESKLNSYIKERNDLLNESHQLCEVNFDDVIESGKSQVSSIFDFESLMALIDSIDIYYRIALSILIGKWVIVSATFSIIFALYGDYLISKYKLEERFPKLAKIIQLRRKLQRYYLILAISWILIVSFTEILFCVSVLSNAI